MVSFISLTSGQEKLASACPGALCSVRSARRSSSVRSSGNRGGQNLGERFNSVSTDTSVGAAVQRGFGVQRVQRYRSE